VFKADQRKFYDVWFPNLAPSADLLSRKLDLTDDRAWGVFSRAFRREMNQRDRSRELDVLAKLSRKSDFSMGCYCSDESRCHRSLLRELLKERGAKLR